MTVLQRFNKNRFILHELVKKGIKLKYRKSYLGIVWSLIEPLMTTIILVVVFGTLFKNNNPTYPLYIIIGRLLYGFFSNGTTIALRSIRGNAGMIKKVAVSKYLYPLSSVIYNFYIFLISLIVLFGVQAYCKVLPTWHILQAIPALLLLLILTYGVGLFLCTLNVFFKDIEYLWNVALLMIMYVSAIFYYPQVILSSKYWWLIKYNPLYQIIALTRDAFMAQSIDVFALVYSAACSFGSVIIGALFFRAKQNKFILHI